MSDSQDPVNAGETQADPAPAGDATTTQTGSSRDASNNASAAELRILRRQLKEAQQRLSAVDEAAAEKARAEMTELERYKSEAEQYRKQFEDLQARSIESQKHSAFKLAAQAAGAVDMDAAIKLADLSKVQVDGDQVAGVDSAIEALRKARPYLFGTATTAEASSSGSNPKTGAPGDLTREMLRSASREQFAEIARARGDKHFR